MKATGYVKTCPNCNKEFELFSDDGRNDTLVREGGDGVGESDEISTEQCEGGILNYCPHCGHKNDVWVRKRRRDDDIKTVPLALDPEAGNKLRGEYADLYYIKAAPTVQSKVVYADDGDEILIEGWFRIQELYKSGKHGDIEGERLHGR